MKRIGYLYEKIYNIENIKLAIKNSSKGKRNRWYVRRALKDDKIAERIQSMLKNKLYYDLLGNNKTKIIFDRSSQKERLITVPKYYPDQIVHWAIIQVIQPILCKGMYRYSCGSVPGRGGLAAKKYISNYEKYINLVTPYVN